MPRWLRTLILTLAGLALVAPAVAACADDDATAAPAAFVSPVDGKTYCAWVNITHECDNSGYPPAPFPMPTDQPTHQPGMSDADFLLLGALFWYGLGHHSYYYSEPYYNHFIGPAYTRYPGYRSYGYGHAPLARYSSVKVYNTTVINHVDRTYARQEATAVKDPKLSTYKTANGKTYTGTTVPKTAFKGTNVVPRSAAGDAPRGTKGTQSGSKSYTGRSSISTGKGYSGSSSRSSSHSSSSHSGRH